MMEMGNSISSSLPCIDNNKNGVLVAYEESAKSAIIDVVVQHGDRNEDKHYCDKIKL
jgi:hypothetical protein